MKGLTMYDTDYENGVLVCNIHRTTISKRHGRLFCLKCQRSTKTQEQKIKSFAELLERQRIEELRQHNLACEANILNAKVTTKQGKKYIKVDVGPSGAYMVEISTEKIFGIKAYGVIHRGHYYGTLDEIHQWIWGGYAAVKIT